MASGRGEAQGLAVWAGATRGFEDLEQGDAAKVNRIKSGIVCSHLRLQRLVEEATALRARCRHGLVVGCGPVEPEGWEQQWRSWLGAPAATVFRWRSSGADVEMAASNAAQEAAEAAAAALVAKEVAEAAWAEAGAAAAVGIAAEAPSPHGGPACGPAWLPAWCSRGEQGRPQEL